MSDPAVKDLVDTVPAVRACLGQLSKDELRDLAVTTVMLVAWPHLSPQELREGINERYPGLGRKISDAVGNFQFQMEFVARALPSDLGCLEEPDE